MELIRGVGAVLAFLVGLFTIAGCLYSLATNWAYAGDIHQPMDPTALAGGLIGCAVGMLFLFLSRALDPEHGPIRSYRRRPRKSRSRTRA